MLIARAPLRISFGGGGTDLAAYYTRYRGAVVSAAINRYCLVVLNDGVSDLQIVSADYGTFHRQPSEEDLDWKGALVLPKAIVHHFGVRRGLNVFLASEVPPGTGLGSSSSLTVALVSALSCLIGNEPSQRELAELAAYIEIEKLGTPIGKQDHYAAAFGGLNLLTFHASGVDVEPLQMAAEDVMALERSLMLFSTGSSRNSSSILRQQRQATERNSRPVVNALHAIKRAALDIRNALESGDLEEFGRLLDFAWAKKKMLAANISNPAIDHCYTLAKAEGAWGGKVTGAGGGGFLLLCAPDVYQERITEVLEANGLRRLDFRFDFEGARVLFDDLPGEGAWLDLAGPSVTELAMAKRKRRNGHQPHYRVVAQVTDVVASRRPRARGSETKLDEEVS